MPPGSYRSGAIILLTDGRRTIGPDPLDAARLAAERGVKVYTVGFGTSGGASANIDGMSIFMRFDEETLKAIARLTGGRVLPRRQQPQTSRRSTTVSTHAMCSRRRRPRCRRLATAIGAALALVAAALSVAWFSRTV